MRQLSIDAMNRYFGFEGKTAIITGSGTGIGKGIADLFSDFGANVVLCGRRLEKVEEVASAIRERGGNAIAVRCDIGVLDEVKHMVAKAVEAFGDIDILVNNAAAFGGGTSLEDMTYEEWDRVIHVNMTGTFYVTNEVIPYMKKKKKGKILMISSGSALGYDWSDAHYAASKGGMIGLAYHLASELMPYRINVNALAVGSTDTEAMHFPGRSLEQELKDLKWYRVGLPYDQAAAAAFLCSEAADYITGHVVCPCGGVWTY